MPELALTTALIRSPPVSWFNSVPGQNASYAPASRSSVITASSPHAMHFVDGVLIRTVLINGFSPRCKRCKSGSASEDRHQSFIPLG